MTMALGGPALRLLAYLLLNPSLPLIMQEALRNGTDSSPLRSLQGG